MDGMLREGNPDPGGGRVVLEVGKTEGSAGSVGRRMDVDTIESTNGAVMGRMGKITG